MSVSPASTENEDEAVRRLFDVGARRVLVGNWRTLVLDALCPLALYQILVSQGVRVVPALCLTTIFPLGNTAAGWLRDRRVDAIGILILVFIAAGVVTSLSSGDARFVLIKGSVSTAAFGVVFLVSLILKRPLAFYFGRQFYTGGKADLVARWDGLWEYPTFRCGNRVVSAVWGCGLILEALIRGALVYILSIATFLIVAPLIAYGFYGALLWWTVAYSRRRAA
jgi:hypothetical protein